jgi:cytochrome c oxidase cbb3-type subunit I
MIVPSPLPSAPAVAATAPSALPERPELSVAQIEGSCRMPVLTLVIAAAAWLGIGALLGLISAIKAHAPGFLAAPSWLTYGRVYPAANTALVYGFLFQTGLGMALWMLCRLGRNLLHGAWMISGAALLWNAGLILGVCSVLAGGSTGQPWLELPAVASPILFCSNVLIVAWALVTLYARRQSSLYVSQWFLLAGLLWFPWVYSTAQLLLVYFPVRGVMQAIVNGWYVHNLFDLCLASFGLAAIFYFLPKLLGRPLYSRGLALFGFWLFMLFGGWGGLHRGEPVPNWISSVSVVAGVFILLPVLAFVLSWIRTMAGTPKSVRSNWVLRFILVSMLSYVLAILLETVGALPGISRITGFTLFSQGVAQLKIHGFMAMALAGAVYYIVPRLAGIIWPTPGLIAVHFWSATVGMGVSAAALVIGGLVQGIGIEQPQIDFLKVVRRLVPFLGTTTLGTTLLLVGYGAMLVNLGRLLASCCPCSVLWKRVLPVRGRTGTIGRVSA